MDFYKLFMKKTSGLLLSVLIILLIFFTSSCSPKFYAPTTAQTPLFRQKGETQISGHIGIGDEIDRSIQFQAASAIYSHVAVFGTFYQAQKGFNIENPNDQNNGKGSQLELALGYFNPITNIASYELYGGIAAGQLTNNFYRYYQHDSLGTRELPYLVKTNFIKPFIQGNIGTRSRLVDFIFNLRVAYLHIGKMTELNSHFPYTPAPNEYFDRIESTPHSILIEPGFTLRLGFEPVKLQLHIAGSWNSNGEDYPQEKNVVSLGIVWMINSSSKKAKTSHLKF